MSTTLSVIIAIEVLFTLFVAWGIMHEERFAGCTHLLEREETVHV